MYHRVLYIITVLIYQPICIYSTSSAAYLMGYIDLLTYSLFNTIASSIKSTKDCKTNVNKNFPRQSLIKFLYL